MLAPSRIRNAMTMIEVMIAMAVIAIGLMTTFDAVGTSNQSNNFARTRNQVMAQFQKAAEKIQASAAISTSTAQPPYVTTSSSSFDVAATGNTGSPLTPWVTPYGNIKPLVTVRPKTTLTVTPPGNTKAFVITVNWHQDNNNLTSSCDYYYAPRP